MPASSGPPTAPGSQPILGHTVPFLRDALGTLQRVGRTAEDVEQVRVAGRQFCLVAAPSLVSEVLVTDAAEYRKADIVRENLGTLQGGSLVLLEGEQWRERRGLLQEGFTGESVTAAGSLTTQYATRAVADWPTAVRADERMRTLSLSILARALFGLDLRGGRTPIHEAAEDILARMNPRTLSAFLPEWAPTPANYRFRRAVATLHERIDAVVAEAAAEPPEGNLLSVMLASGLDPNQIRDELIALLFAGYDSTATGLALTLGLLGDHPEEQAALRRELADTLDGETPTPADLDDLPRLDAVVRESLRLYPPQYVLLREPESDVELGGYRIEQGTTVVVSPWVCQRDPAYWAAPGEFRPQRWRCDRERPEFAYIPYGSGPRHCLGRALAAQTIRLVVAVVLQHRQLQLQGDVSVSAGPTLSPGAVELRTFPDAR
jgi:cytochrome P450